MSLTGGYRSIQSTDLGWIDVKKVNYRIHNNGMYSPDISVQMVFSGQL